MIQVFFIAGFSFLCTIPLLFLSCFHQHLDDTATQSTMQSECRLVSKIMPAFPTAPPDESENYRDKEKDLLWFSWKRSQKKIFQCALGMTVYRKSTNANLVTSCKPEDLHHFMKNQLTCTWFSQQNDHKLSLLPVSVL